MFYRKCYLASRRRWEELGGHTADIEQRGGLVTSQWLRHNQETARRRDHDEAQFATEDVEDILLVGSLVHLADRFGR